MMKIHRVLREKSKLGGPCIIGMVVVFVPGFLYSEAADEETTAAPDDLNFDLAVKAQVQAFKYQDEQPYFQRQTQFIDENVESWSFAYNGSEASSKRAPFRKHVTWGIGILGIDYFEKQSKVTAMGALIHPQIVMTLCACVNSFYRSYKGILFEEKATQDVFKISNTSDPQFDIATPDLIAYWSSKEGYLRKTGEENLMLVSKHILTTDKCTTAVEGKHINVTIQQYKVPAFLLLAEAISNPFGADLEGTLPFIAPTRDDEVTYPYRKRPTFPLELMAYRQRPCHWERNITNVGSLKVWRVPSEQGTGDIVQPQDHLLTTGWTESFEESPEAPESHGVPWRKQYIKECNYFWFERWKEAYMSWDQTLQEPKKDAKEFLTAFAEAFQKPEVGCLKWAWGNLCDAPPGSPVFYWKRRTPYHAGTDTLIALTITSPSTKHFEKMGKSTTVIGMMLTHEAGRREMVEEVEGLIDYVANLAKVRLQATDYPNYNKLEETEKIPLELVGNLDVDLIKDLLKGLKTEKAIPLSRAERTSAAACTVLLMISVRPL